MPSQKQEAIDLIQTLPESSTTLDILESLLVKKKIEEGLLDIERGDVLSSDDLEERLTQ